MQTNRNRSKLLAGIIIFAVILLGIIIFLVCEHKEQERIAEIEAQKELAIKKEIDSIQEKYFLPVFQLFNGDLTDDVVVVATVNFWPITKNEIDYRKKMREIFGTYADENFIFNYLVEEKVMLSQAQALGLLPTKDKVNNELNDLKQEIMKEQEYRKLINSIIEQWGISEDDYWQICEAYNQYRLIVANNLSNVIEDEWWNDEDFDYTYLGTDAYYWLKKLEYKKSATIEILDDSKRYTPIMDKLFSYRNSYKYGITEDELMKELTKVN
jgi:hypothetical protein